MRTCRPFCRASAGARDSAGNAPHEGGDLLRDELQTSPCHSQHGEGVGELDTHRETCIGDEHPLLRVRLRSFVRDQSVAVRASMRYKEIVSRIAREGIDGRRRVLTAVRPRAQVAELCGRRLVQRPEESRVGFRPVSKFIRSGDEFLFHRVDRTGQRTLVCMFKPAPEAGSDVEGVVTILRLDQNVCVDEVYQATPNCSASPMRVLCFLVPRRW